MRDPLRAIGYSDQDRRRLTDQAALYDASTRQLLADAGVGAGARVLDVGCGVGDVSLLAASLAGPGGSVLGVDADGRSLAAAEGRARRAGIGHLRFLQGDLRDLTFDEPFDAVVGRFVLMFVPEPASAVRRLAAHVRPGGVLAFQEFHLEGAMRSWLSASSSLYERSMEWVVETLRRTGVDTAMGLKLARTFHEAGLPAPTASVYCPLMSGAGHPGYQLFADVLRATLPLMEALGVATADTVDVGTYARRLADEVVAGDAMAGCTPAIGAWTTKPPLVGDAWEQTQPAPCHADAAGLSTSAVVSRPPGAGSGTG